MKDIHADADTIPIDLIHEVGHAGQYLIEEHTLEYCRKELFAPNVSVRGAVADPRGQLDVNIEKRMTRLLETYKKPEVPAEIRRDLKTLLLKQNIEEKYLDMAIDS